MSEWREGDAGDLLIVGLMLLILAAFWFFG